MWEAQLFGSLPMLLDFVNEHALEHHQFKVVVVPPRVWQRRSSPRYYLIYRTTPTEATLGVALEATADAELAIDEAAAINTASAIIANAQQRGQQNSGESDA